MQSMPNQFDCCPDVAAASPWRSACSGNTRERKPKANAFTLMEMLVAMASVSILLTVVAVMISNAVFVVRSGTALSDASTETQTLEVNLRRDLRNIARDGFMVIRGANKTYAGDSFATDQLFFFSNVNQRSVNEDAQWSGVDSSGVVRVWYGHLETDSFTSPFDFEGYAHWALGRQDMLLNPMVSSGNTSSFRADSLWAADVHDGSKDVVAQSLLDIRNQVEQAGGLSSQRSRILDACNRLQGQRWVEDGDLMKIHALLAANCSDVRIQFAGDYNNDGELDTTGGRIQWYGMNLEGGGSTNTGESLIDGSNSWVFGYDQEQTPWPRLIRFTGRLYDSNVSIEDGRQFQIIAEVGNGFASEGN